MGYKINGGKNKLIEKIKQGYNIRFDLVEKTIYWNTYTRKDCITKYTYFFDNVYNWNTKKQVLEALQKIFEHFDYIENRLI